MTLASWINEDGCTEKNLIIDFFCLFPALTLILCTSIILLILYIYIYIYFSSGTLNGSLIRKKGAQKLQQTCLYVSSVLNLVVLETNNLPISLRIIQCYQVNRTTLHTLSVLCIINRILH